LARTTATQSTIFALRTGRAGGIGRFDRRSPCRRVHIRVGRPNSGVRQRAPDRSAADQSHPIRARPHRSGAAGLRHPEPLVPP
jgi:hypothetical protein